MCSLKSYLSDPYKLLDLKTAQKRKKNQIDTAAIILNLRSYSKLIIDTVLGFKDTLFMPCKKSLLCIHVVRPSYLAHLCHYIDTNNTKMENKTL